MRWAQAAKGLLVYTWRSDGSTVEPSDRLSIRNLADGQPIATINVLNDYGAHSSMSTQCGGILSADRIVVCRWQGEDRTVMLIDRTGTSVAQWPATDAPVIDQQAEMLALFGTDPDDTVTGVDASGQVRWTVGREQFKGLSIRIDVAHDGVMVGAIQSANLAIASRTGKLLVAEDFDQLRPGGVIGNYVVEMRDGAAVGFTASGVGVGCCPTATTRCSSSSRRPWPWHSAVPTLDCGRLTSRLVPAPSVNEVIPRGLPTRVRNRPELCDHVGTRRKWSVQDTLDLRCGARRGEHRAEAWGARTGPPSTPVPRAA